MMALEQIQKRAESDAKTSGYYLNPDPGFLRDLLEGLKQNEERYGYLSCPCRLASGKFDFDRDILCPCDYRDPDVLEFGACYCALYVRKDIYERKTPLEQIKERRPLEKQNRAYAVAPGRLPEQKIKSNLPTVENEAQVKLKLWYCRQCGYVVFREEPPYVCPICKAKKEMFAKLEINISAV